MTPKFPGSSVAPCFDWHVHPDFSPDAKGSVRDYCTVARRAGLAGLCFTTHYEPDPARATKERVKVDGELWPVDSDWVGRYLETIASARVDFPDLVLLAGVEVGFEPGLEEITADFLGRHRFDFVLGSVHSIEHVALSSGAEQFEFAEWARRQGSERVMASYYSRVAAAAESRLFDALGHLDIYRKYAVRHLGIRLLDAVERELPRALSAIARSGTAIEVNTSAFRRGDDEPYPARAIIESALAAGVRKFTIGSDAHCPADVGAGLVKARCLLRSLGRLEIRGYLRSEEP